MRLASYRALRAGVAVALLAAAGVAAAQTADEIMEKNIKAVGGRDALTKVKSVDRSGDLNVTGSFGDMAGSTEIKYVVGEKAFQKIDMGAFFQTTAWTGGDAGWKEDGMNGLVDLHGDELSQLKAQAQANPFLEIKKNGATVKRLDDEKAAKVSMGQPAPAPASGGAAGEKKEGAAAAPAAPAVETVDCYALEITPSGGAGVIKMLIDKKTDLIYQMKLKRSDPQFGDMEITVENSEYEKVDDVKLVKNMKLQLGELLTMEMIFTKTKLNGEIDAKAFEKPAPAPSEAPAGGAKKSDAKPDAPKKDAGK